LDDYLPPSQAGSKGKPIKFIKLGPCKDWILRQLNARGALTAMELKQELPVIGVSSPGEVVTKWSSNSISARLTEMTTQKLVTARYVKDEYSLVFAITALGRKAIRGEPV
jgi:hypothetical protein